MFLVDLLQAVEFKVDEGAVLTTTLGLLYRFTQFSQEVLAIVGAGERITLIVLSSISYNFV